MTGAELSDRVAHAVAREREAVAAHLASLRDEADRRGELTSDLQRAIDEQARLLHRMDELLGLAN
jgi:hypothetical protein